MSDTTTPDFLPTHRDVVNALRLRIVTECTTSTSSTADLAALVSAYNGTDYRESMALSDQFRDIINQWQCDKRDADELVQAIREGLRSEFRGFKVKP